MKLPVFLATLPTAILLLAACAGESTEAGSTRDATSSDLEIVTVLSYGAIPAIFDPRFVTGEEAWKQYADNELVLGISIDGDHRAYSIPYLSRREIVNDVVGGVPVTVTW